MNIERSVPSYRMLTFVAFVIVFCAPLPVLHIHNNAAFYLVQSVSLFTDQINLIAKDGLVGRGPVFGILIHPLLKISGAELSIFGLLYKTLVTISLFIAMRLFSKKGLFFFALILLLSPGFLRLAFIPDSTIWLGFVGCVLIFILVATTLTYSWFWSGVLFSICVLLKETSVVILFPIALALITERIDNRSIYKNVLQFVIGCSILLSAWVVVVYRETGAFSPILGSFNPDFMNTLDSAGKLNIHGWADKKSIKNILYVSPIFPVFLIISILLYKKFDRREKLLIIFSFTMLSQWIADSFVSSGDPRHFLPSYVALMLAMSSFSARKNFRPAMICRHLRPSYILGFSTTFFFLGSLYIYKQNFLSDGISTPLRVSSIDIFQVANRVKNNWFSALPDGRFDSGERVLADMVDDAMRDGALVLFSETTYEAYYFFKRKKILDEYIFHVQRENDVHRECFYLSYVEEDPSKPNYGASTRFVVSDLESAPSVVVWTENRLMLVTDTSELIGRSRRTSLYKIDVEQTCS